jgi:2-polyprenyl-3-methyl-5-hydroxy-6-metoxy-1,4-benzoquinol methylase
VSPSSGLSIIQEAAFNQLMGQSLMPGSRILDAPCGGGRLSRLLQECGYDVAGVDLNPDARELLGEAFHPVDLCDRLPFPNESFDCVVSAEGIEHLENPAVFLRELHRVLRPEGLLLLTTPNTVSVRSRVRFFGSGFFHQDPRPLCEASRDPMHHVSLRTLSELRYEMVTSGFSIRSVGHTHVKPIGLLYSVFVPWIALYTAVAFRKEKDPVQRRVNREILGALLSKSALFGENLLIIASRNPPESQTRGVQHGRMTTA